MKERDESEAEPAADPCTLCKFARTHGAIFVHLAQCSRPLARAMMAACGCKHLGADSLTPLHRREDRARPRVRAFEAVGLQSHLGSGLCSTYLLGFTSSDSSTSSVFRSPPFLAKSGGASYSSPIHHHSIHHHRQTDRPIPAPTHRLGA